jgi:DNA helicase-2/ATP-dependent DNA helicase PcrA
VGRHLPRPGAPPAAPALAGRRLPQGFQILDSDDQLRLVKRVLQGARLDERATRRARSQWFINAQKDEGKRPEHIQPGRRQRS